MSFSFAFGRRELSQIEIPYWKTVRKAISRERQKGRRRREEQKKNKEE